MKSILSVLLILFISSSCELSTEQETQLNKDLANLLEVRNSGDALSYLNHTHPIVVKYYKSLGDSIYKQRFQAVKQKSSRNEIDSAEVYWTNAYQKKTQSNDSLIQVEIQVSLAQGYEKLDSTNTIYAFAKKDGSNWLFVEYQDYFSDYFPAKYRLFKN